MPDRPNSLALTGGRDTLVRIKDIVPMSWAGLEDLLNGLRKAVIEHTGIKKITIEDGKSFITLDREVTQDEAASLGGVVTDIHSIIRSKPLEEYAPETAPTGPHQQLYEMFKAVTDNGFEVSHVLVSGPTSVVFSWLKMPRKGRAILGVGLHFVKEIPDDVIIVCGSNTRDGRPEDIEYSFKGTMS